MIIRNDFIGEVGGRTLVDDCIRIGGRNIYGEPMFRVCLAQDRVMKAAGEWNQWDDDVPVEERGGLNLALIQQMVNQRDEVANAALANGFAREDVQKMTANMSAMIEEVVQECLARHPKSVFTGMSEVQIYPNEGWIIEKWKPADAWGSPADWYRYAFQGVASLGPYPQFGGYELIAGPSPTKPTVTEVETAIRRHFQELDARPASPAELVARMMSAKEERNRKRKEDRRADIEAAVKDGPISLHNRISLGAGRVIQEAATRAGLSGHYGN